MLQTTLQFFTTLKILEALIHSLHLASWVPLLNIIIIVTIIIIIIIVIVIVITIIIINPVQSCPVLKKEILY